jgi:hypothetical protein
LTFTGQDLKTDVVSKKGSVREISYTVDMLAEKPSLDDIKKFWDMERAFNDLTKGRLHVNLYDEIDE